MSVGARVFIIIIEGSPKVSEVAQTSPILTYTLTYTLTWTPLTRTTPLILTHTLNLISTYMLNQIQTPMLPRILILI